MELFIELPGFKGHFNPETIEAIWVREGQNWDEEKNQPLEFCDFLKQPGFFRKLKASLLGQPEPEPYLVRYIMNYGFSGDDYYCKPCVKIRFVSGMTREIECDTYAEAKQIKDDILEMIKPLDIPRETS